MAIPPCDSSRWGRLRSLGVYRVGVLCHCPCLTCMIWTILAIWSLRSLAGGASPLLHSNIHQMSHLS